MNMLLILFLAGIITILFLLSRVFMLCRVRGNSMLPFLDSGSLIFVDKIFYRYYGLKCGAVVLFQKSGIPLLVKRISKVCAEKKIFFLQGDNLRESLDSRVFGDVNMSDLKGKVLFVISFPLFFQRILMRIERYLGLKFKVCHAWGSRTHVYIANLILWEVNCFDSAQENGQYNFLFQNRSNPALPNLTCPVAPKIIKALQDYPEYFRAGSVGPDGTPDLPFALIPTHEFGNAQMINHKPVRAYCALHMLDCMWDGQQWDGQTYSEMSEDDLKALAYWCGWLVHFACDAYGHHWVGEFAGGPFETFFDLEIARKHLAMEHHFDKFIAESRIFFRPGFADLTEEEEYELKETKTKAPYVYLIEQFLDTGGAMFLDHLQNQFGFDIQIDLNNLSTDDLTAVLPSGIAYRLSRAYWLHGQWSAQADQNRSNCSRLNPMRLFWRLVRDFHDSRIHSTRNLLEAYLKCGQTFLKKMAESSSVAWTSLDVVWHFKGFYKELEDYLNPLDNLGDAVFGNAFSTIEDLIDDIDDFLLSLIPDEVKDLAEEAAETVGILSENISDYTDNLKRAIWTMAGIPPDIQELIRTMPISLTPIEYLDFISRIPFAQDGINYGIDLANLPAFYNSWCLSKLLLAQDTNELTRSAWLNRIPGNRNYNTDDPNSIEPSDHSGVWNIDGLRQFEATGFFGHQDYMPYFLDMAYNVPPIIFIGNVRSHELHLPICPFSRAIRQDRRHIFQTIDEALAQGYNGCAFCLPDYDTDIFNR
ncbi:MAG: hypothetical protein APR62_09435 [Smithella sp. SDB]|nr:MAG: hypothetical protein APR62_09435 [Smithella sp. SDB]